MQRTWLASCTRKLTLAVGLAVLALAPAARADDWPLVASASLTKGKPKLRTDLETLGKKAKELPSLFSSKVGTIVGGKATKGVKIKEVDDSARIDVQSPPGKTLHNVQYQVGETSYASVLFTDTDSAEDVINNLLRSFDSGQQAESPDYQKARSSGDDEKGKTKPAKGKKKK